MNKIEKLRHWIKQFNLEEIVLWLDTIASHPANQDYALRISFTTAIALSIDEKEYDGRSFKRSYCINLFDMLDKQFNEFIMLEDFKGFDQSKRIPLFWKNKKYFFYYGGLERPHEYLLNFTDLYLDNSSIDGNMENIFVESLLHQTKLLNAVLNMRESSKVCNKSYKIYVPTEYYFNQIKQYFIANNQLP
ncbi:MAG: hypothetical protein FVQ82_16580, partial [Planctomycetes bacterium]|nr:hypothetical protein [Planctomycetota bacterium]